MKRMLPIVAVLLSGCVTAHWSPAMQARAERDTAWADKVGAHRCDGVNDWDDRHGPTCDRRKRHVLGFIKVTP